MTKIRCRCCHRTAKVEGPHEFDAIKGCRNGTYIETGGAGNPRIGATNQALLDLWDAKARTFEPLLGDT